MQAVAQLIGARKFDMEILNFTFASVTINYCKLFALFCSVDPLAPPDTITARPDSPLTKNVHIQTDYRDSEAQTDPYSPEYVVRPGSAPELLTLATLSYGMSEFL